MNDPMKDCYAHCPATVDVKYLANGARNDR